MIASIALESLCRGLLHAVGLKVEARSPEHRLSARVTPLEQLESRLLLSAVHGRGPNVVYVPSNNPTPGQNAILAYRRDPDTGALQELRDSPFLTGGTGYYNADERLGPDDSDQEVVTNDEHTLLFVANQGSDSISVFRIRQDGRLKLVPSSPFYSGGKQPVSIGLSGRTLIVVNKGDELPGESGGSPPNYTSFRVKEDGRLSQVPGSQVIAPPGSSPSQALISRNGRFVFGADLFAQPFPAPPGFPPFLPPLASQLRSLRIGSDGRLTPVAGTPLNFPEAPPTPPFMLGMEIHPRQNILYVGFVAANKVGVFTYDNSGAIHFDHSVPLTGAGACWLTVSPDGKLLYAANSISDSIDVLSLADPLHPVELQNIDLNGPKAPLPPGPAPTGFDTTPFQLSLSPDARFLYVVNHEATADDSNPSGNALHILRVKSDGTLEELGSPLIFPESYVPAGAHPLGIVVL